MKYPELKVEHVPIDKLVPYVKNANVHTNLQIEQIANSIEEFGFCDPVGVWENDKGEPEIVEGHGRVLAAKKLKLEQVPVIYLNAMTDEQRRAYTHVHNQLTRNSSFDTEILEQEIELLDFDWQALGFDLDVGVLNKENTVEGQAGILASKFIIPPFSILDSTSGDWRERKKYWRGLIGDFGQARESSAGMALTYVGNGFIGNAVSILDPVLAELVCRWFTPYEGAECVDPFAGDTVFGYVASTLGHNFTGIELRQEQADFNNDRTKSLSARYICDDGRNVLEHVAEESADLLFSCPPYYDIEVYSDLENDASNQESFEEFYEILDTAFTNAIKTLKPNRFAAIVVGDVLEKKTGNYYLFPERIVETFTREGMALANRAILRTSIGSARFRASKQMEKRRLGRCYQHVLIFYKGSMVDVPKHFPILDFSDVDRQLQDESDYE